MSSTKIQDIGHNEDPFAPPNIPMGRFQVLFQGQTFDVDEVLSVRVVAVVLRVTRRESKDGHPRIINLFPKAHPVVRQCKCAFTNERAAYERLKDASCRSVPRYFGSTREATIIYPRYCSIPEEKRLVGPQRAILLDFIEGELLTLDNYTEKLGQKAISALKKIHRASVYNSDIHDTSSGLIKNVMVTKEGKIKWIDFEYACVVDDKFTGYDFNVEHELRIAKAVLGKNGYMAKWKRGEPVERLGISTIVLPFATEQMSHPISS